MKTLLTLTMIAFSAGLSLRAEDWKTTDGKVYQDVKVVRADADTVTIMHHDGGGQVPLANLPPDLQKRFDYDPAQAKVAADERAKSDADNRHRLQTEMNQPHQPRGVGDAKAPSSTSTDDTSSSESPSDSVAASPAAPPAESSTSSDSSGSTHHTIGDLTKAAQPMRRDLSDPSYHTTAHMVYVIRQQGLGPDKSDPNHHSIGEIHGL